LGLMAKTSRTGIKQTNPYIAMLLYKLQNDKPISRREREDLEDHLKKIGVKTKEGATEAMKISDIPAAMRRRLTMKDIEDEQPKGAYRYRVHHGQSKHERPRDFMNKSAADEYARAVKGRVEDLMQEEDELAIPGTKGMNDDQRHAAIMKHYPEAKRTGKTPGEYTTQSGRLISGIQGVRHLKDKDVAEGEIGERELTAHELERREEIVKGMKKNRADFEKRYGDRAKSVMYATATKIAKNEDINESRRLAADEGYYYCEAKRQVKEIPEGYIKVAGGYIMKKI